MSMKLTPQQTLDRRVAEALSTTFFPEEYIAEGFKELLKKALMDNSILRINVQYPTWENFILNNRPFLMGEVTIALNILRAATPREIGQSLEENLDMLFNVVSPMQNKWNEIYENTAEPIRREINAKVKSMNSVPLGKQIFGEKPN